jgi:hypothetical protein
MNPSRIAGAYDEIIDNLMEDMGVNAQIKIGKLYHIRDGKIKSENDSWSDYIRTIFGYTITMPSNGWDASIKRTINTFATGSSVKDQLLAYLESHYKSVISTSKRISEMHGNLTGNDDIHLQNLLRNFTEKIHESIIGLENLKETYKQRNEVRFVARMGIIIRALRDQVEENNTILNGVSSPTASKASPWTHDGVSNKK